ncbi:MAG: hypothetical protein U0869_16595 [Chloroflexota bacterium]
MRSWRPSGRPAAIAVLAALAGLAVPAVAAAHNVGGRLASPLPFVAYLGGAVVAVGVSFLLLALSDPGPPRDDRGGRVRTVPRVARLALRAIGLIGWLWVAAQAIIGGSSDADVASLFLWEYGWIGLALISAFLGPVWRWIDPFTTIFDLIGAVGRRLGIRGMAPQAWPERLAAWPAVIGFGFFVWLELVSKTASGRPLGMVMLAYTAITVLAMAQFGRDEWRARGETFGVWFGTLGRLARYVVETDGDDGRVRRRPFGSGLVTRDWDPSLIVLVALGTGSIIFDGLSQTDVFFRAFGVPSVATGTVLLAVFMAIIVGAVLAVGRIVGLPAMGAGLLPVAVGYLIAHYLSTLLTDGQRIVTAISDPFQQGWDLFGTAFWEPQSAWLSTELLWTIEFGAVVIGHIIGAWAGHAAGRATAEPGTEAAGDTRRGQVALAVLMVLLTSLTLWSLGQSIKFESGEPNAGTGAAAVTVTVAVTGSTIGR